MLNVRQKRIYDTKRKQGLGVATAYRIATADATAPAGLEWLVGQLDSTMSNATGTYEGWHVTVTVEPDYDFTLGEDDVTGTFVYDEDAGFTIKNPWKGYSWGNGSDAPWYKPSNYDRTELLEDLKKSGVSKGRMTEVYAERIRQASWEDHTREYASITVEVALSEDGVTLGAASLHGIDSIDGYEAEPYYIEVVSDLLHDAINSANREIATLKQPSEIIHVSFTTADVRSMAEEAGIPESVALDRARSWGKHITETVTTLAGEQLASVVATNEP